jgi:hypothetical protein
MNTTFVYKYPYFTYTNNNISTIQTNVSFYLTYTYPKIKTLEQWKNFMLEKIMNNSKNVFLLNNNNKNIINEKKIIVNSYGFYSQFYYKNKTNKQTQNYIILKINSENIYIYFENQYKNYNKNFFYKENILTKKIKKQTIEKINNKI